MKDLIEALQILAKYSNDTKYPTSCEHGELYINCGFELDKISEEDIKRLDELNIFWDEDLECFVSYRFGSN